MARQNVDKNAVLDLDQLIGEPKNRIHKVGIEVEGGWNKLPSGFMWNPRANHDGSVFRDVNTQQHYIPINAPIGMKWTGEISSGPRMPAGVPAWIKKHYPQVWDKTCGFHVHMSFENKRFYALLEEPAYPLTVVEYFKRWATEEKLPKTHCIWERLDDQNQYCQHKFWPELQVRQEHKDEDRQRHGHRYTFINYCYGLHGTLECRGLPMFDSPEQSIRAYKRLLDVTNASLILLAEKEKKIRLTVPAEESRRDSFYMQWYLPRKLMGV